jgi:hypothetical protein
LTRNLTSGAREQPILMEIFRSAPQTPKLCVITWRYRGQHPQRFHIPGTLCRVPILRLVAWANARPQDSLVKLWSSRGPRDNNPSLQTPEIRSTSAETHWERKQLAAIRSQSTMNAQQFRAAIKRAGVVTYERSAHRNNIHQNSSRC